MDLLTRYQDAYFVVRTVNAAGQTVKMVGFVLASLIAIGGWVIAARLGLPYGFVSLFFGALVAIPFYALGVLVAAQGQILMATLDTAVNCSPLLSHDQVRHILIGSGSVRDTANPDGHCPQCASPYWYADYRPDASQILCGSCSAQLPKQAVATT